MRQYRHLLIQLLLYVLLPSSQLWAMAFDGSTLFFEERPSLIPIGRSVMGIKSDFRRSSDWMDNTGGRKDLGENFTEKITTQDGVVERTLRVKAAFNQFTPYWGYGLSSSWSLFAGIPIHQMSSRFKVEYGAADQNVSGAKVASLFNERSETMPYTPEPELGSVLIGHVFFLSQMSLMNRPEGTLAFLQKLRVPTGEHDDWAYFINGSPDPSGYGLELGLVADYRGPYKTQFFSRLNGSINFSDTIYARENGNSQYSKIERDPGETIEAAAGIEKEIFDRIHVGTDWTFVKTLPSVLPENVTVYNEGSNLHLLRGTLAYRSPGFLQERRWDEQSYSGRLIYSQVITGRNTPEYQSLGFELSLAY